MENSRIIRERNELILDIIDKNDTILSMVDKINSNFGVIREYQGGRQGIPGLPGLPGCSTGSYFSGGNCDCDSNFDTSTKLFDICKKFQDSEAISDYQILFNKIANDRILFNNIAIDNNGLVLSKDTDNSPSTAIFIQPENDSKLTIINSDEYGVGKHITLANSYSIINNNLFGCKSGFDITVDRDTLSDNTEFLRFKANKNEEILNHTHKVEFIDDLTSFRKNSSSQALNIDSGTDIENKFTNTQFLTPQLKNNIQRISNRTGWNAIWQDFYHDKEEWDVIDNSFINISNIKYKLNDNYITENAENGNVDSFEIINNINNTTVRFKRLNNWILIDYHINIKTISEITSNIYLNNLRIKINTPTIGCSTINWLPGSSYNVPEYDKDSTDIEFPEPTYYKIDNFIINDSNSFLIDIKCKKVYFSKDDLNKQSYYLDGQCWASVKNGENSCPDTCEYDITIQEDN